MRKALALAVLAGLLAGTASIVKDATLAGGSPTTTAAKAAMGHAVNLGVTVGEVTPAGWTVTDSAASGAVLQCPSVAIITVPSEDVTGCRRPPHPG